MWQLLLPLALGLGTMGLGRAELTTAQHRGLQVALEEFHKHPPVLWAFQVTSVDNAADTVSASPERGGGGRGIGRPERAPHREQVHRYLGPSKPPSSPERPPAPAPGCAAARWGAGTGHTRNSTACSAGPRAFSCLLAALPGRAVCEAGVQAPADELSEERLEERRLQSQAQRGELMAGRVHRAGVGGGLHSWRSLRLETLGWGSLPGSDRPACLRPWR